MIDHFLGFSLDRFQQDAIRCLDSGGSVLVVAPTGTGKTLVADFLIDKMLREGQRAVFTAPLKSICNQKFRTYQKLFGEESIGLVTGDVAINPEAPVLVMTTEILRNILLRWLCVEALVESNHPDTADDILPTSYAVNPHLVDSLGAVIIDEIHYIGDSTRGTAWEESLIYLPNNVQILGLSATIKNIFLFSTWLNIVRDTRVRIVQEKRRAVPLKYLLGNREGIMGFKAFETKYKDWKTEEGGDALESQNLKKGSPLLLATNPEYTSSSHTEVLQKLFRNAFPAIYFIFERRQTEAYAYELSKLSDVELPFILFPNERQKLLKHISTFDDENPGLMSEELSRTLAKGIACHHAGMHHNLKDLIEQLYEEGLIKVLYCTSTFAMGVNMPARTVVFDSIQGTSRNKRKYPVLTHQEFMQMAGRAGRRGLDTHGQVVLKMDFEQWKECKSYMKEILHGDYPFMKSSFNLSFVSALHLIVKFSEEKVKEIVTSSLQAHQLRSTFAGRMRKKFQDLSPEEQEQIIQETEALIWKKFKQKLKFLRKYNYISNDNKLYAAGKVCIQLPFKEILVTELFQKGIFDGLEATKVYGVLCGIALSKFPTSLTSNFPADPEWEELIKEVKAVAYSEVVTKAMQITGKRCLVIPEIMPLAELWAKGASLPEIMDHLSYQTDFTADLITAFRYGKHILSHLRQIMYEDVYVREEYEGVLRLVSRDELKYFD